MRKVIALAFITLDGVIQAGGAILVNYARAGAVTTGSY